MLSVLEMHELKALLGESELTCVISRKDGELLESVDHGIMPIVNLTFNAEYYKNARVADKIVGKAAALLYAYLGVGELYGEVMSASAVEIFKKFGIKYSYGTLTEKIMNHAGDDICPMEKAVENTCDPNAAKDIILEKVGFIG